MPETYEPIESGSYFNVGVYAVLSVVNCVVGVVIGKRIAGKYE